MNLGIVEIQIIFKALKGYVKSSRETVYSREERPRIRFGALQ